MAWDMIMYCIIFKNHFDLFTLSFHKQVVILEDITKANSKKNFYR